MDYMGGTESNVSRDANISGTHTRFQTFESHSPTWNFSSFCEWFGYYAHLTATELLYLYEALSPGSIWQYLANSWYFVGGFPVHILCHDLRWCQLVRHYNEPTFRTVTRIQPSTQEGLDAPWTTGAAQEIPVDRHLKGFSRGEWLPILPQS